MGKEFSENDLIYGDFEGTPYTPSEVIFPPAEFVDGVHMRQVMPKSEFPIKIQLIGGFRSVYEIWGFANKGAVYTCIEGGFSMRGIYYGKVGKDFLYV